MKILKMTTHWSTEEADCVFRVLDELQTVIWENYGDDIEQLYERNREEQWALKMENKQEKEQAERQISLLDEIPF